MKKMFVDAELGVSLLLLLRSGQVLVTVPSRVLLEQVAEELPSFCKVGTQYNHELDMEAGGFISVTRSVRLLKKLKFKAIFIDEAHHSLPPGLPSSQDVFQFSATHTKEVDFRYGLGDAIESGVLCDYDLTVPVTTEHHPYICLANLLLSQSGRFRRVLAFCNSIRQARRFQEVLETVGLAAWHMNGKTSQKGRATILHEFSADLQKPVHVLVTVQVLGEGVNIPNADTCMFVEPRSSFVSIIQAIGRVLRQHPGKPIAHIILPALVVANLPPVGSEDVLSRRPYDRQAEAETSSAKPCLCGGGSLYQQPEISHTQTSRLQEYLQLGSNEVMHSGGDHAAAAPAANRNGVTSDTQREVSCTSAGMEGVAGMGQEFEGNLDCLEEWSAIKVGGVGGSAEKIALRASSKPTSSRHVRSLAEKDYSHASDAHPANATPVAGNAPPVPAERLPLGKSGIIPVG